jgi:hypothetical protein
VLSAFVGREVELTNGCFVGAACQLTYPEVVPENTVIYGSKCSRRRQADKPPVSCTQVKLNLIYRCQRKIVILNLFHSNGYYFLDHPCSLFNVDFLNNILKILVK